MMQPVFINRAASIHADATSSEGAWLSACEPDYKGIITNPTLRRRMSRIVKMGVACGLQCIGSLPANEVDAIITATGLGCMADTEKFLCSIIDNEEQLLNPTPFIQSTFNTIGGQIALLQQIHAYNMTYVHRGLSFESALLDAIMKIEEGSRNVLVGALDEMTPTAHTIHQRLGLLKDTCAGEGAQFFLLGQQPTEHTLATIVGVTTFSGTPSSDEITERILRFLQQYDLTLDQVNCFVNGRNGNTEEDSHYAHAERLFTHARCSTFKNQCGEYPTAASYAVWQVANAFATDKATGQLALIYNHYHCTDHSLILIRSIQ